MKSRGGHAEPPRQQENRLDQQPVTVGTVTPTVSLHSSHSNLSPATIYQTMKPPADLVPKNRKTAIHFLRTESRPSVVACGTPVSYSYTTKPEKVTCRACWEAIRPKPNYFARG